MKKNLVIFLLFLMGYSQLSFAQGEEEIKRKIEIKAIGGLKFDLTRIKVKPGERVKLTLTNADDMDHNLVITKPGARQEVVDASYKLGENGPKQNYIPKSDKVLWSLRIVTPGQSAYIIFQAPMKEDVYPYVCTFPGHGLVMYGAMYVTTKDLPPLEKDPNVPPANALGSVTEHDHSAKDLHPYKTIPPYMYRIFMPDAGPAAIAVSLPNQLSYCWDAGSCRLRYAWQGEFLDPKNYFDKKAEKYAKIMGTVFYRDKTTFPLKFSPEKNPVVDFKGYKLIDRYPEFHYTIDGRDVYELIKPKEDGSGLIRSFKVPEATRSLFFVFNDSDGVEYTTSKGTVNGNQINLTADDAHEFVIIMTKKETAK
ncbi:MAG TPA: plastocyanin/azurin family copper-binding protein [Chryseolinea sp.]|nr:plastocyanin/azurin family copper-binding protein [Chryseolinea sp.]